MKQKQLLHRIQQLSVTGISILSLLAGTAAYADDAIVASGEDDFADTSSGTTGSVDAGSGDSGFLIEDTGQDVQYEAGVPMDTLQDAMDAGDKKTLEKIASLGALTDSSSSTASGSGVGGSGAYRGDSSGSDVDPDEYYDLEDLQLDEGDADEVETELSESPGTLIAANADRLQEHLDYMMQVESPTGSEGELTVAAYIESKLDELGYTVQEQAFHEGVLNEDGTDAPGINILAERGANSQTNRKKDIFLIVTHYDSKRSPEEGDPFANDKSGAAALIETARILSDVVTDTDICFVFLSGEEDGGYGAQNFIDSLSEENRSRITGVMSVERVGYDSDTPYVLKTLTGEANPLGDIVQQLGIANDAHIALTEETEEDEGTWVAVGESSDGYIDEAAAAEIAAAQAGETSDVPTLELDEEGAPADGEGSVEEINMDEEETEAEPVPMPSAWSYLKSASPTLNNFANQSFTAVSISQYMPDLDAQSYEETKALGLADTTVDAINQMQAYIEESADGQIPDVATGSDSGASEDVIQLEDSNLTGSADDSAADPGAAPADPNAADPNAADPNAADPNAAQSEDSWEEDPDCPMVDAALIADTTNVIAASLAKIMDPAT